MRFLIIIPARGGSKGIPKKNIKPLNGKPLIYYTIDVARQLTDDLNICVSTDDPEIIKIVENYGLSVPFIRPAELATDTSPSNDFVKHALKFYKSKGKNYEVVILLQPTSPFKTASQVKEALHIFTPEIDMVVSVKESESAAVLCKENDNGFLEPIISNNATRRQDSGDFYEVNGAIYIINIKSIENKTMQDLKCKIKYLMPGINSLDIDTSLDWSICETILEKGIDLN